MNVYKVAAWVPISREVMADFARTWQERAVILNSADPNPFPRWSVFARRAALRKAAS